MKHHGFEYNHIYIITNVTKEMYEAPFQLQAGPWVLKTTYFIDVEQGDQHVVTYVRKNMLLRPSSFPVPNMSHSVQKQ